MNKKEIETEKEKAYTRAELFKFLGLISFFVLTLVLLYFLWPYIKGLFQTGGLNRVLVEVRNAGTSGMFILLGLQFLQIVVAFIPGEVVQIAAGLLYGAWLGGLIILIGCVVSSAFIYMVVHKLGAPFVQAVVPTKALSRFKEFEGSGKLNILVFILFLIPGLPKDVFTYLVPLTDMKMKDFLVLSNLARAPGIIVSTYAANGIMQGDIIQSAIIFAIGAALAVLGLIFRENLMDIVGKITHLFSKKDK